MIQDKKNIFLTPIIFLLNATAAQRWGQGLADMNAILLYFIGAFLYLSNIVVEVVVVWPGHGLQHLKVVQGRPGLDR